MEPARILTYHLSFVLRKYAEDFVGIQETRYLLDQMDARFGELVKEAQRILPLQKVTEILQRLVSEDISVRNLRDILEALVEWGQKEKDPVLLAEYVRGSLRRYISYKYSSAQNLLPAYLLDPDVEERFAAASARPHRAVIWRWIRPRPASLSPTSNRRSAISPNMPASRCWSLRWTSAATCAS
jgi:type III secretory pathway component EscV